MFLYCDLEAEIDALSIVEDSDNRARAVDIIKDAYKEVESLVEDQKRHGSDVQSISVLTEGIQSVLKKIEKVEALVIEYDDLEKSRDA